MLCIDISFEKLCPPYRSSYLFLFREKFTGFILMFREKGWIKMLKGGRGELILMFREKGIHCNGQRENYVCNV